MYFRDRKQAGLMLANRLMTKYLGRNSAVLALSEGGLLVGEEIARMTHSSLNILLTQDISLPGEKIVLGQIDSQGTFTYNRMYSPGQLEEFNQEYLNHIAQEKRTKLHEINRMVGRGGFIRPETLRNHVVFVVSDGANSGLAYDVALSLLKPIKTQAVIAVSPVASISAVDRLHVSFDEVAFTSVVENYLDTNHYYEDNELPDRDMILQMVDQAPLKWVYPQLPNTSALSDDNYVV